MNYRICFDFIGVSKKSGLKKNRSYEQDYKYLYYPFALRCPAKPCAKPGRVFDCLKREIVSSFDTVRPEGFRRNRLEGLTERAQDERGFAERIIRKL